MGMTKRELAMLGKFETRISITLVPVMKNKSLWWSMLVHTDRLSQQRIETAVGTEKVWQDANKAIKFVQQTCPTVESIVVKLKLPEGSAEP